MYPIKSLLHLWGVLANQQLKSKKRALQVASDLVASNYRNIPADELFDSLLARERLGSTAIGHGIAIPHSRLSHCTHPVGALLQLQQGIDFEAPDGQAVDLIFVLVVPEQASRVHLDVLSSLVQAFSHPQWRKQLRSVTNSTALYERAIQQPGRNDPCTANR